MFNDNLVRVGKTLVEYCNTGQEALGLSELYDANCVSVEAADMAGMGRETHGLEGIKGKHAWWNGAHDMHGTTAEGPYFCGDNQFAVRFWMDVTTKETGQRMQATEVGVYTINKDGHIIREEFFYGM